MRYQITGSWWNVSADKDEEGTLFDTRQDAEECIPELAKALECDPSELQVIERDDLQSSLSCGDFEFDAPLLVTNGGRMTFNYDSDGVDVYDGAGVLIGRGRRQEP